VCTAKVFYKGAQVTTIGDIKLINMKCEDIGKTKRWTANWPIPWNPNLGEYKAEITLVSGNDKFTATVPFKIKGRLAPPLPKGFCVMDIEPGESIIKRVPGVGGKSVKIWENYTLWSKFMGADAMWDCVGQSQIWDHLDPQQFPWEEMNLKQIDDIGAECHKLKMKFGGWITSFVVLGNRHDLSPYAQTIGYDKENDTLRKMIYVSIMDQKRRNDIADLLKRLNDNPNVDFVGLDYVRTDFGGYEYAAEFVKEMPLPSVPADWNKMTDEQHMLWMGRRLEVDHNLSTEEMWRWWRAHKMSFIIKEMRERAHVTKPMWVFTLTWKQGKEHGQDPLMFIDAGVDINSGMFYSIDHDTYPGMVESWREYLQQGNTSLVVGQCVDWNLLGKTFNPAGPDEHYLRQKRAVDRFLDVNPSLGLFWHDLTRAFKSTSGPYSPLEWAIAGGASFTYLREKQGLFPFDVTWDAPDDVQVRTPFTIEINLKNTSPITQNFYIKLLKLQHLSMPEDMVQAFHLTPGEVKTFTFNIEAAERDDRKEDMQMIGFMVQYGALETQQRYFKYKYIKVEPKHEQ
jgi:hypothetical protein